MTLPPSKRMAPNAGWILVVSVMLLCLLGTWLTARNYKLNVFSSAEGVVLENQWPESRIAVVFPRDEASRLKPGQGAKITVGKNSSLLSGEVLSITPADGAATVIIRLIGESGSTHGTSGSIDGPVNLHPYLTPGTKCAVTIDTTIPTQEGAPAR